MRKHFLQPPTSRELCVFCATRLYFPSLALSFRNALPTRPLQTSSRAKSPIEYVSAVREEQTAPQPSQGTSSGFTLHKYYQTPTSESNNPEPGKKQWYPSNRPSVFTQRLDLATSQDRQGLEAGNQRNSVVGSEKVPAETTRSTIGTAHTKDGSTEIQSISPRTNDWSSPDTGKSQDGHQWGGWAGGAEVELTPEEVKLRDELSKPAHVTQHKDRGGRGTTQPARQKEKRAQIRYHPAAPDRSLKEILRRVPVKKPVASDGNISARHGDYKCECCGRWNNHQKNKLCFNCNASPDDEGLIAFSEEYPLVTDLALRRLGNWNCDCGKTNYQHRRACHNCGKTRDLSKIQSQLANMEDGMILPDVLSGNTEDRVEIAWHWKHLRRRTAHSDVVLEQRDLDTETSIDNVSAPVPKEDLLTKEREERLQRSAGGAFVGFTAAAIPASPAKQQEGTSEPPTKTSSQARSDSSMEQAEIPVDGMVRTLHKETTDTELERAASVTDDTEWHASVPDVSTSPETKPEKADSSTGYIDSQTLEPDGSKSPDSLSQEQQSWSDGMGARETVPRFRRLQARSRDVPIGFDGRPSKQANFASNAEEQAPARIYTEVTHVPDRNRGRERQRAQRSSRQFGEDFEEEEEATVKRIERKRQRKREKLEEKSSSAPTPILLPEFISIGNLAAVLRVRVEDFSARMESLGFEEMGNDHVLDAETAGLIASEFNFEPIVPEKANDTQDLVALPPVEDKTFLLQRPPVITIMGHVDHGKTTLLDWLRKSSVAASEHGGITQHIGAFTVPMPSGRIITFLDTPGHAAFLSMRQRGANVTDIVILVVAADDSVKPQTIEAIKHAQTANVPMIVAVNKIDKPEVDVERVKQDLARHGVEIEDYGGDTQVVCVSGKTGQGMEELEESAVALADVLDMRAETDGQAEGWILEATTRKAGRVATVLVRRGTIVPGSVIVAGSTWARVRSLRNEAGIQVPSAGPGTPIEIDGWREQPEAGDEVLQAPDEQRAKAVVELRLARAEQEKMATDVVAVNEARRMEQEKREAALSDSASGAKENTAQGSSTGIIEVPFIVRADVSGSVEAVVNSISSLGNSEVRPSILRSAVGPIAPTDVEHAAVAKGHIISFNTPIEGTIRRMAEAAGVSIVDQNIIYRLTDEVKAKLEELLPPLTTTRVVGEAEIAEVFGINTKGRATVRVAGCRVRNGVISKGAKTRVLRGGEVVYDGQLSSLKNRKKDVTEMRKDGECGIGFDGFTDFAAGDQVQCYEEKSEKRRL